jgi:hypothetical protein
VLEKAFFLAPCQAGEEEPDAGEIDERPSAARRPLVVLGQTAIAASQAKARFLVSYGARKENSDEPHR